MSVFSAEFAEMGDKFEGDIVMTPELERLLKSRSGLMDFKFRWPNKEVPFEIIHEHFCKDWI
jgi:hypothetical protein